MQTHLQPNDPRTDFVAVEKFCKGLGLDIGPGTNKFSPTVLCTDWYQHEGVDLIWNMVHEGGRHPYPFRDNVFDFVFASHVIEDFAPDEIQWVFDELLRMVKPNGHLVILVPDMENLRYPDWDEVFTSEDEEVKTGKRQSGELKGNPSHRLTMGMKCMNGLVSNSKYKVEVVQADTFPHNQMTLDFIIQKK